MKSITLLTGEKKEWILLTYIHMNMQNFVKKTTMFFSPQFHNLKHVCEAYFKPQFGVKAGFRFSAYILVR